MEWMYAAKGGNLTPSTNYNLYSGTNYEIELPNYAWYSANNSPNTSKEVGTRLPNELGIYDMSGNVWEWVWDIYGNYPPEDQNNPTGATTGNSRVRRSCGWYDGANECKVHNRKSNGASWTYYSVGFRVCRSDFK
jgi:formylglycine-generating enzyme required for sulfatase activity